MHPLKHVDYIARARVSQIETVRGCERHGVHFAIRAVVFTSVVNILTTPLGSLPYAPNLGSPIPLLVFDINDATTRGIIKRFVEDNLRDQEPRARVLFVRTVVPEDDPNRVVVTVAFQIVGDPEGRVYTAPVQFNTLSLAA